MGQANSSNHGGLWKTLSFSKAFGLCREYGPLSVNDWDGTKIQVVDNWESPKGKKILFAPAGIPEASEVQTDKKEFPSLKASASMLHVEKGVSASKGEV